MPQTLISVGALVVASLLMLSTTRHEVRQRDTVHETEVGRAASNVAIGVVGLIARQPFDNETKNGGSVASASEFESSFPTGWTCFDADGTLQRDAGTGDIVCDDVDDFNRMTTASVDVDYVVEEAGGGPDIGGALSVSVDATVRYVDVSGAYSPSQTYQKEVRVAAWHPLLRDSVRFTQVVSYTP